MQRRHIPARAIDTLGDISFDTALQAALRPSPDYDTAKWLFVPNTYTEYRYILGTRGARPLICLGVNPSTAAPEHLDPTLQSVQRIALNNGFDSFIMLNVCAQRATSPSDMALEPSARLHAENVRAFAYALSLSDAPSVWAACSSLTRGCRCQRDPSRSRKRAGTTTSPSLRTRQSGSASPSAWRTAAAGRARAVPGSPRRSA